MLSSCRFVRYIGRFSCMKCTFSHFILRYLDKMPKTHKCPYISYGHFMIFSLIQPFFYVISSIDHLARCYLATDLHKWYKQRTSILIGKIRPEDELLLLLYPPGIFIVMLYLPAKINCANNYRNRPKSTIARWKIGR